MLEWDMEHSVDPLHLLYGHMAGKEEYATEMRGRMGSKKMTMPAGKVAKILNALIAEAKQLPFDTDGAELVKSVTAAERPKLIRQICALRAARAAALQRTLGINYLGPPARPVPSAGVFQQLAAREPLPDYLACAGDIWRSMHYCRITTPIVRPSAEGAAAASADGAAARASPTPDVSMPSAAAFSAMCPDE